MEVLGIRFCAVAEEARELAESSDYFESPRDIGTGTH